MAKVTSKLQVTIPKAVAAQYNIRPGDEIDFVPAGDAIRVVPSARESGGLELGRRLELFDRATQRQRSRQRGMKIRQAKQRGWTREELYVRGGPH
jgi:AbrB family looped-hinge helix DNA binding protein